MTHEAWLKIALTPGLTAGDLAPHLEAPDGVPRFAATLPDPDPGLEASGLAWLAGAGNHLVPLSDPGYPPLLREIPRPPVVLFVRGEVAALGLPQLAIVGSRNATPGGLETAASFAHYLAARGFCITSGLAEGIDAAAHRGALAAGGRTVAVCGTGPDVIYPRQHAQLAGQIAACAGAVVSEFAPGTPVARHHFPRRNRLISGLAVGTLVVEASVQSGALITARHAMEQGREVFAIPGSIHNPVARGCHRLIREGAKLVETAADIVDELGGLLESLRTGTPEGSVDNGLDAPPAHGNAVVPPDADYARLLQAMGWDPVDAGQLVGRAGLTIGEVSSMLLLLEMRGTVQPLSGGRYQRVRRSLET